MGFPGSSEGKASAYNVGDLGSIPGSRRSPGEGNGNPLQYSCLENPMEGGARWATAHGVTESDMTEQLHFTSDMSQVGFQSLKATIRKNFQRKAFWWTPRNIPVPVVY